MSSAINYSYSYPFASTLIPSDNEPCVKLATFGGIENNPYFFDGKLQNPKRVADLLLALSSISRTRFFSPALINFFFVLSPDASRGFSGEGQALSNLARPATEAVVAKVRASLAWQNNLDPTTLSHSLRLNTKEIENALQILGTRGLVGFDVSRACYFHRELPFDLSLIEDLQPRMTKARRLAEEGAVKISSVDKDDQLITANVRGDSTVYLVQIKEDSFRCTCEWHLKHGGNRGPCSHVLAVELSIQEMSQ